MKVLLVEDDAETASFIIDGLARSGHVADCAATGPDALSLAIDASYDALIVDRMLPEMDGLSVVKALRTAGVNTPVLFLTALSFVSYSSFFLLIGGSAVVAFVAVQFMDEPQGHMVEVGEDGTVQLIEVS